MTAGACGGWKLKETRPREPTDAVTYCEVRVRREASLGGAGVDAFDAIALHAHDAVAFGCPAELLKVQVGPGMPLTQFAG